MGKRFLNIFLLAIFLLDVVIFFEFLILVIPGLFKGEVLKSFGCSVVLFFCSKVLGKLALDTAEELGYLEGK